MAFALAQELAAEYRRHFRLPELEIGRVETHLATLFLISRVIVVPRAIVVAEVLVGFAQREAEMDVRARAQAVARELCFHGRDVGIGEAEDLKIREAPVDFAEIRLGADRRPVRGDRARLVAEGLQHVRITHLAAGQVRIESHGAREGLRTFLDHAGARESIAEACPGFRMIRREFRGCLERVDGVKVLAALH